MKTACLPLLAALSWALTAHAAVPDRAGEVTFLIGEARITSGPDTGSTLRRGSAVMPGQQIETSDNGHLHIRFVDGAAVAVRPMTRLRIDDYTYAPNDPSQNRIRFFLQEGALRSITGKAGEANKDRFRINTPVAAIGIRGTDFNVQTTEDLTRASLFQGAIVMSPLGDQCSSAGLGPCVGANALELNEQRRSLFAIQTGVMNPIAHLVPKRMDLPSAEAPTAPIQPTIVLADARDAIKNQPLSGYVTESVVTARADQVVDIKPGVVKVIEPLIPSRPPDPVTPELPTVEPPIIRPVALTPESDPKIWWGRWAAFADPADASTLYTAQRKPQDERAGANAVFGLLRTYSVRPQLPTTGGQASFALSRYEAYTLSNDKLTPAVVTAASLSMNFDTRRFSTALDVAPSGAGIVNLHAVGRIEKDGQIYSDAGQGMSLRGALANQGQQAGYAFERLLAPGTMLYGATAWTR